MSTSVMAACWALQMPPTPKAVLISLADNANDQGECWPSLARICERTCFGKTAVIQAIQWLEEHGLVQANRANGRHTSYRVVPNLAAPDLFASRTGARAEPVRQTNPSGRRSNRSASRTGPVREADTNHQEPPRTASKSITVDLDFSSWPSEPSPQVLADWLDLRKRKKATVTPTAMRGMGAQLHKAAALGYDVDAALTECVLRGWQGLNADWLRSDNRTRTGPPATAQVGKTMQGIMALEGLKRGNRVAAGSNRGGDAETLLLGSGKDPGG